MLRKLATLVFLCASILCAQQEQQPQQQAEQKTQEESVDVTIKIFKWAYSNAMTIPNIGGGVSTVRASKEQNFDLWYKSGDAYKVLKVSSGSMSNAIHYKGPRTMVFYKREAVVTEDGTQYNYREACRMTIPLGIDELFAMMFKTGRSVVFYPINVSPKTLPKEKIAVINMTSHRVALMVGKEPKLLGSGANAIFKPKQKGDTSVEIQIARMVDRKWKPVYHNNVSTPKDARCVVLLYDPVNRASPKFTVLVLTL